MEKVHLISLGCPKNLVDSEIMAGVLQKDGYEIVGEAEQADTVVINTCGFIGTAREESIAKILETSELKGKGQLKRMVVAGCLSQRYQSELVKELPEVDLFIGSGEFQRIDQIFRAADQGSPEREFFHLPTFLQQDSTPRVNSGSVYSAYLKISEGCKKRCAFCAIPVIRGPLQSRTFAGVISEAELLVAGGVREINVVSHDFTDFGLDLDIKDGPARLLEGLSDIRGLDWIRVLYLYPDGVNSRLIDVIKERSNLVKYFDMPLQHINDRVLRRMNRKMTRLEISKVLDQIRSRIPDAVIRTQFIVGFPGETESEFDELIQFIQIQKFDRVGCFIYSPEEKTGAYRMSGLVDEETKQRRFNILMETQKEISFKRNKQFIGKTLPVLIEGYSEETELLLKGRSSQQAPDIDGIVYVNKGQAQEGDIVSVLITESHDYDLVGEIVPLRV